MDAQATLFILAALAAVNLLAALLCIADKARARRGAPRMRERTLLALAAAGGSSGLLAAMLAVRHKTRKPSFLVWLAIIVAAQAFAAWWALGRGSA